MRSQFNSAILSLSISLAAALGMSGSAYAQGTGTVASPVIKPGASISLAGGVAIDDGEEGYAHRFDYRQTLGENIRMSAMLFYNDRGGEYRYRRLEIEGMYQFASSKTGWNSAVQVRGRLPDGNDGTERVRVAWLNRWRAESGQELRLIGLASREFGDDRREGVALETRAEMTWPATPQIRAGVQMFNRYNTTSAFGSFNTQRHSVGAVIKGPLSDNVSYRVNALAGVSDGAADAELRVRLRLSL